jgi:hypothetical protein
MAEERFHDSTGHLTSRITKSDKDVAGAQDTERLQSAAGLGARQKGGASNTTSKRPMPKQADYGSLGAWSAAMRQYRKEQDEDPENQGQKRALAGMAKK